MKFLSFVVIALLCSPSLASSSWSVMTCADRGKPSKVYRVYVDGAISALWACTMKDHIPASCRRSVLLTAASEWVKLSGKDPSMPIVRSCLGTLATTARPVAKLATDSGRGEGPSILGTFVTVTGVL